MNQGDPPGAGRVDACGLGHLHKLNGGSQWTIATAREHLSFQSADPWASYWTSKQSITGAMKTLGYTKRAPARKP
jgi:bifunctional non-homologous end joining protein LigD